MAQVNKKHYLAPEYLSLQRFLLHYEQIKTVLHCVDNGTVLEIGVGSYTVVDYLKKCDIKVTTCDFDQELVPDILGDIRDLPIKNESFDIICAFEVLEHIPFADFRKALEELRRVTKKYAIISLPIYGVSLDLFARLWRRSNFSEKKINFGLVLPYFWRKFRKEEEGFGQHYWEIGAKGMSRNTIFDIIKNSGFNIETKITPCLESTSIILILNKKKI